MNREKLKISNQSKDKLDQKLQALKELFPSVFTERVTGINRQTGEEILGTGINIDELRQQLADVVIDNDEQRYEFNWAGKNDAIAEANRTITDTLRPCIDESKNFHDTENLYIEGDNLKVLKALQETYLNKIKMIYIDPPYNTGKDFIYKDNYTMKKDEYDEISDELDEDGNRMYVNSDSSGRYHTSWLNMMYPRLTLARDLLKDDGVIFISIDDNEVHNLRKICDEVFGEENFVDTIIWKKKYGGGAKEKYLVSVHEYILMYAKNMNNLHEIFVPFEEERFKKFYKHKDDKFNIRGYYRTHPLEAVQSFDVRENLRFSITAPDGTEIFPKRQWRWSKERFEQALKNDEVIFSKNKENQWILYSKQYINDENGVRRKTKAQSLVDNFFTQQGTKEIKEIFSNSKTFDFPKPISLIKAFLNIGTISPNDIILDFFSGSATTAHAVMKLNAEDGGNRKFIMVQVPEETDEKSEAFKSGYSTISEIGKERIRRAGEKIQKEMETENSQLKLNETKKQVLDIGFRVLKLDSTNYEDTTIKVVDYEQTNLNSLIPNIKEGRSPLDLLFDTMLRFGIPLSSTVKEENVNGKTLYKVSDTFIYACFDENLQLDDVEKILKNEDKCDYFVIRENNSDSFLTSCNELVKQFSPSTIFRIV